MDFLERGGNNCRIGFAVTGPNLRLRRSLNPKIAFTRNQKNIFYYKSIGKIYTAKFTLGKFTLSKILTKDSEDPDRIKTL
jgi:hypothetical protein